MVFEDCICIIPSYTALHDFYFVGYAFQRPYENYVQYAPLRSIGPPLNMARFMGPLDWIAIGNKNGKKNIS